MNPSIDIVIPCAGRIDDLLRLLRSLQQHCAQSLASQVASITLTDDRYSSALGEQVALNFPGVRYLPGPARGPAANRNNGAKQGQAAWILFLDDDCLAAGDLVGTYAQQMRSDPEVDVFEGAIHPVGLRPNGNHHAPLNTTGGQFWSCNIAVRRSVFTAISGFDEVFPYACMEDCDLRDRLIGGGYRTRFLPQAAVQHPWRSISEREVTRQIVSHAIYARKHAHFVRSFSLLHTLRALAGRVRLYRSGRFTSIPLSKYRTVAYDFVAPLLVYAVVHVPMLRNRLWRQHANHPAVEAR